MNIEEKFKEASVNIKNHIEILYIDAICKIELNYPDPLEKSLFPKQIRKYLLNKGYTENYILKKPVMINKFTAVYVSETYLEIWHDTKNSKSIFIKDSFVSMLPLVLNYMERI